MARCVETWQPKTESIITAIDEAIRNGREDMVVNFYGDGHAAERIAKVIGVVEDPRTLLRKRWHHVIDVRGDGERGWQT